MNKEEVIATFVEHYKQFPQYKLPKRFIWVRIKSNTGRPGETWFKKGDITFVTGCIEPPKLYDNKWRITLFSYRHKLPREQKYMIGNCSVDLSKVDFIDDEDRKLVKQNIERYLLKHNTTKYY